ncbi:MAG: hypothetical protein ACFCU1_05985 [Sumerlaeia bacterium]
MKFFLWFFGIIAAIILIIVGLYFYKENEADFSRRVADSLQATSIDKNKNAPPTPVPTPLPVGPVNYPEVVGNTAIATGTRSTILASQGKFFQVELAWGGSNAELGTKYLESLNQQNLLKNATILKPLESAQNNRGQMQYSIQYQIEFK